MINKKCKSNPIQGPNVLYENRYCNQEGFSILICGGYNKNDKVTNEVLELEIPSFKLKKFPLMVESYCYLDLVNIKSDILAVSNSIKLDKSLDESTVPVEIYSNKTKTWTHKYVQIDEMICYCVGSFMSKL